MSRLPRWVVLALAVAAAAAVALSFWLRPDAGHVSSTASDLDTTATSGPADARPLDPGGVEDAGTTVPSRP